MRTALLLSILWLVRPAAPSVGQSLADRTTTPDAAAQLFLRSVRAIRWDAAAQLMDARSLARFHDVVTMVAEADSAGDALRFLTGTDREGYAALSATEVFDRAIGTMIDSMPGLMHALYDRDDEVIGPVLEAEDTAHVVYRTTARLSGAVSEVKVMQLVRTPAGWRVLWSDELAVLDTALRGIPLRRRPPRPPGLLQRPTYASRDDSAHVRREATPAMRELRSVE